MRLVGAFANQPVSSVQRTSTSLGSPLEPANRYKPKVANHFIWFSVRFQDNDQAVWTT
jgi:hypothetical protein